MTYSSVHTTDAGAIDQAKAIVGVLAMEFALMEAESALRSATFFALAAAYAATPSIAAFVWTGGMPWLVSAVTFSLFTVAFSRAGVRRAEALASMPRGRGMAFPKTERHDG